MTIERPGAKGNDRNETAAKACLRAENCFSARSQCCSEAVFYVLNRGFRGGLPDDVAVRVASGFCHGMGEGKGTCGAATGGILALGLFLGPESPGGLKKKKFRGCVQEYQDRFSKEAGALACCELLDMGKEAGRKKMEHCRSLTGLGARLAVEILMANKPELAAEADLEFLEKHDSKLAGFINRLKGR